MTGGQSLKTSNPGSRIASPNTLDLKVEFNVYNDEVTKQPPLKQESPLINQNNLNIVEVTPKKINKIKIIPKAVPL